MAPVLKPLHSVIICMPIDSPEKIVYFRSLVGAANSPFLDLKLAGWCCQYLEDQVCALSPVSAVRLGSSSPMVPESGVGCCLRSETPIANHPALSLDPLHLLKEF